MSNGQQQNQNQNQKGGNQQKAPAEGITTSISLGTADVSNPSALANKGIVLGAGALLLLGIRWGAPLIQRHLFGVEPDSGPSLAAASINEVGNRIFDEAKANPKNVGWLVPKLFAALPEDQKQIALKQITPAANNK